MHIATKRRLAAFLSKAEPALDILGLLFCLVFFLQYIPLSILTSGPATGGDMGSHYWSLVTLVKHSLPELTVRTWNPGNLGGETLLINYFPMPFFIMAGLSCFMPLSVAFNIGTILPMFVLPLCVFFSIRLLGLRFPAPIFAAAFSLLTLYNESFSMWGGNTLSTLAGQFSHFYALDFLLLAIGFLFWEYRQNRFPFFSSLLLACVATSHAYVLVGIPFYILTFLFVSPIGSYKDRFKHALVTGVFSILLSLWFIVPLIQNAPWTTAFYVDWNSGKLLEEALPTILYPAVVLLILFIGLFFFLYHRDSKNREILIRLILLWLLPTLGYAFYYFVFPSVGLVNIRAFPQIYLNLVVLAGSMLGFFFRKSRLLSFCAAPIILCTLLYWINIHVVFFPSWARWNYSGWKNKAAYPALSKLYTHLRGDFSLPRVVYENNSANDAAGTPRVFEMLPYFTGRATLESVYLQASILAPAVFLLQSEISLTPSCPFIQYQCVSHNLEKAYSRLRLLGVGDLILVTKELIEQADSSSFFKLTGTFGKWKTYQLSDSPSLVEVFKIKPKLLSDSYWKNRYLRNPIPGTFPPNEYPGEVLVDSTDWKDLFYAWLRNYSSKDPMIFVDLDNDEVSAKTLLSDENSDKIWASTEECKANLTVSFDRISLHTSCPGRAHYLKFAYSPTWKADTGDSLYMVSPGFIALIPSKDEVNLTFGPVRQWQIAGLISIFTLFGMTAIFFCRKKNIKK